MSNAFDERGEEFVNLIEAINKGQAVNDQVDAFNKGVKPFNEQSRDFYEQGIAFQEQIAEYNKAIDTYDKETAVVEGSHETVDHESDDEISKDAQAGVQAIEAFTKVWTTSHIVIAYCTYVTFPNPAW